MPKRTILFSRREVEVMTLSAQGKTYEQISIVLSITQDTAKAHMETARAKLGASNKTHAIALAVAGGHIKV